MGTSDMGKPINVLIVEDSKDDALLLLVVLRREGYEPDHEQVKTREAMREATEEGTDFFGNPVLSWSNIPPPFGLKSQMHILFSDVAPISACIFTKNEILL